MDLNSASTAQHSFGVSPQTAPPKSPKASLLAVTSVLE